MRRFDLIAQASPFLTRPVRKRVPCGATVADCLVEAGIHPALWRHVYAEIDGVRVPAEWMPYTLPKAGRRVTLTCVPRNGLDPGYSGIPPDTLRLFLSAVFTVGGAFIPGLAGISGTMGALLGGAIGIAGTLAVNALIPPPQSPLDDSRGSSLQASQNQIRLYEAVPRLYGRMKVFPPIATRPFTTVDGEDQYLTQFFCLGYGPVQIEEDSIRIGDTPLANMKHVLAEIKEGHAGYHDPENDPPITVLPGRVYEEPLNLKLEYADDWESEKVWVRNSQTGVAAQEIGLDFTFPSGLYSDNNGQLSGYRVDLAIQYRLKGTATWYTFQPEDINAVADAAAGTDDTTLYQDLQALVSKLDDIIFVLGSTSAGDQILPDIIQTLLLGMVRDLRGKLNDAIAAGPDQQDVIDALNAQLGTLAPLIASFSGTNWGFSASSVFQEALDALTTSLPMLSAWMDLNKYIYQGHGPSLATYPAFLAWRLYKQGLADVFGDPEPGSFMVYDRNQGIVRRTATLTLAQEGEYELRVRRTSEGPPAGASGIGDECYWTAVRTLQRTEPFSYDFFPNMAGIALRVKASDQLSGVVDQLSCVATAMLPVWDGEEWILQTTRNPAWAFCDVLRGRANPSPVPDDQIDLAAIKAWADDMAAETMNPDANGDYQGRCFDAYIERDTTVLKLLQDIARVGRASLHIRDGVYTVVRDKPQTVPCQVFTPRNSSGFSGEVAFVERPHALRMRITDARSDWQQNEVTVYDDGYDATNATKFETLDLWGCSESDQAWRDGRYHMAVARLRHETIRLRTDFEHLVVERGDLVRVQHDVPMWGLGSARVKAVELSEDGTIVYGLTLDESFDLAAGLQYVVQLRDRTLHVEEAAIDIPGESVTTNVLSMAAPLEYFYVHAGDLVAVGQQAEGAAVDMLVKEIADAGDLGAEVTLVPYAPEVFDADTGPIPPYDPHITIPVDVRRRPPMRPSIDRIVTDESALDRLSDGTLETRILLFVGWHQPDPYGNLYRPARFLEAQVQPHQSELPWNAQTVGWTAMPTAPADAGVVAIHGVRDKHRYNVRVRATTADGVASDWVERDNIYVVGKSTPPPSVTFCFVENGWLVWKYPDPPLDLKGFVVRHVAGTSTAWDIATPAHDGVVGETRFLINGGSGTRTFLVRAIDTSGNLSLKPAVVVVDLGDPVQANLIATYDHRVLGWPGAKDACEVALDGSLDAIDQGVFWGDDGARFWTLDNDAFWRPQYGAMSYTVTFTPAAEEVGCRLLVPAEVYGDNWDLEYRRDTGAALWPLAMTDNLWPSDMSDDFWATTALWVSWPGEITLAAEQYQFRVWISGGTSPSLIEQLKLIVDLADLEELFNDFLVTGAAGNRLTLTKPFRAVTNVSITLQYDSVHYPLAVSAGYGDKQANPGAAGGPMIYVYKADRTGCAGVVDVRVKGY